MCGEVHHHGRRLYGAPGLLDAHEHGLGAHGLAVGGAQVEGGGDQLSLRVLGPLLQHLNNTRQTTINNPQMLVIFRKQLHNTRQNTLNNPEHYDPEMLVILYSWYFLQAFNFRYFHAPIDSAKITSFKYISI